MEDILLDKTNIYIMSLVFIILILNVIGVINSNVYCYTINFIIFFIGFCNKEEK